MVRRSVLVYDLLRIQQPPDGFSQKEILAHISDKYDIAAGKTLQRDVAVALRRGLDFGILAKKRNKFRFDLDFGQTMSLRRDNARGRSTARTKKRKGSGKRRATGRSSATKGGRQRRQRQRRRGRSEGRGRSRKRSSSVPRPRLPEPPSWSPKRRYLAEEPIPKLIKH